jgi:high-affinity iron transporter
LGLLLLAEATTARRHIFLPSYELEEQDDALATDSPEASQRVVFLLQYLATDYDRAVQDGQIVDSLEYGEMQRFAGEALKIYHSTTGIQQQTLIRLRQLEKLIAARAALPQIRKICDEAMAILIEEKNLSVFPQNTPNLTYGRDLFQENCVSCHGVLGAGDGPSADTLNPKPRDFTAPERMSLLTPFQFYQAITFGVEGTAMPSFSEAFAPRQRWNLAFYLMTLRRDFQPVALATSQRLTLQQLATKNNVELQTILSSRKSPPHADSSQRLARVVDYYRQNPPRLSMDELVTIVETGLKQSLAAYQRADSLQAMQAVEEAYWQGFEPIEAILPSQVYLEFERAHLEYRACIEEKRPPESARAAAKSMLKTLRQIRRQKLIRTAE